VLLNIRKSSTTKEARLCVERRNSKCVLGLQHDQHTQRQHINNASVAHSWQTFPNNTPANVPVHTPALQCACKHAQNASASSSPFGSTHYPSSILKHTLDTSCGGPWQYQACHCIMHASSQEQQHKMPRPKFTYLTKARSVNTWTMLLRPRVLHSGYCRLQCCLSLPKRINSSRCSRGTLQLLC
jgi:hypothetical protein